MVTKKETRTKDIDEKKAYLLEITSKYNDQLEYLKHRQDRIRQLGVIYTVSFIVAGGVASYISEKIFAVSGALSDVIPVIIVTYAALLATFFYVQYSSIQSKINQTLNRMRLEETLSGTSKKVPDTSNENEEYFNKLVQINIENLSAYYDQVKSHANKSFIVSLIMSILGFAIITAGLVVGFSSQDQRTLIIFVSAASGIITEAIAALFFYLYTKTVHQMKGYHDGLLYVQNILLSLKLLEGADNIGPEMKAQSINKLIEYLLKKPNDQ